MALSLWSSAFQPRDPWHRSQCVLFVAYAHLGHAEESLYTAPFVTRPLFAIIAPVTPPRRGLQRRCAQRCPAAAPAHPPSPQHYWCAVAAQYGGCGADRAGCVWQCAPTCSCCSHTPGTSAFFCRLPAAHGVCLGSSVPTDLSLGDISLGSPSCPPFVPVAPAMCRVHLVARASHPMVCREGATCEDHLSAVWASNSAFLPILCWPPSS